MTKSTIKERKKAAEQIKQMLKENGNSILLGMVHDVYGPLRGLNFIVKSPEPNTVLDEIDLFHTPITEEEQVSIMKRMEKGSPKNTFELSFKIWQETLLASKLMILPMSLLEDAENPPKEVNSINEGVKECVDSLRITKLFRDKDPFFFRRGIF